MIARLLCCFFSYCDISAITVTFSVLEECISVPVGSTEQVLLWLSSCWIPVMCGCLLFRQGVCGGNHAYEDDDVTVHNAELCGISFRLVVPPQLCRLIFK